MKTVHIESPGKVSISEVEKPRPGRGEILLRVHLVGLCGSDLSSFLGKNPMVSYPVVPGHEIAAEIVEIGEAVPEHFGMGQLVTVNPYTNCGICPSCRIGRINACQYNQTLGVQRDGALSEFLCIPWQKILVADGLSLLELALTEPLSVGFHAVSRGRVTDSDTVVVLGCGMIGAGAVIAAVERGSRVIAVDIDQGKLEIAQKFGAHFTINSKSENLNAKLAKLTNGDGASVVIEAAGNPVTYLTAVDAVAFCGRIICIGYTTAEVAFATKKFVQKELDILGSRNALLQDFLDVITFLRKGNFPFERLISRKVSLEGSGSALQSWADEPGRIMKILVEVSHTSIAQV